MDHSQQEIIFKALEVMRRMTSRAPRLELRGCRASAGPTATGWPRSAMCPSPPTLNPCPRAQEIIFKALEVTREVLARSGDGSMTIPQASPPRTRHF